MVRTKENSTNKLPRKGAEVWGRTAPIQSSVARESLHRMFADEGKQEEEMDKESKEKKELL